MAGSIGGNGFNQTGVRAGKCATSIGPGISARGNKQMGMEMRARVMRLGPHFVRFRLMAIAIAMWAAAAAVVAGTPQLAAGQDSSFAIDAGGRLFAWGSDQYGQLGLGRETYRATLRPLSSDQYVDVAVKTYSTLAIRADGTLWAWGGNEDGQLGNGTTTQTSTPVLIGSNFRSVVTDRSSFGIKRDGTLWAWGANNYGQLGDGTFVQRLTPVLVGSDYASVATSGDCTLAVKTDGALWRWGRCYWTGADGVAVERRLKPAQIGTDFVSASVGASHAVAVKRDGTLWAWGHNLSGELGDGTKVQRLIPVKVGEGYSSAVAGTNIWGYTVALKRDGTLWGWGKNASGELGSGEVGREYTSPQLIGGGFAAFSSSWEHSIAIKRDGSLWTWGSRSLGDGSTQSSTALRQIGSGFTVASAGWASAAIDANKILWIGGDNRWGQLGETTPTNRSAPVLAGADYTSVATNRDSGFFEFGVAHALAIRKDGSLWGWGSNRYGQLGDGTKTQRDLPVQVGTGYVAISTSSHHTIGIKSDGSLWAWGDNGHGELGNGTTSASLVPVKVGDGFAAVDVTLYNSVALAKDGTVFAWGFYLNDELGDGSTADRLSPARVPGLVNITAIARGDNHTLALTSDGTVWAWGRNASGELGDGTYVNRSMPVRVASLDGVVAISASGFSLALKADGSLWAWGDSFSSGLGDGRTLKSNVPIRIGTGFASISAGYSHALAGKADGSLRAWGANGQGQLGDGSIADGGIPVPVVNTSATAYLSLLGSDLDNSIDPFRVLQVVDLTADQLTTRITDLRAAGLIGEVFFTAIVPRNSPLLSGCALSGCTAGAAKQRSANPRSSSRASSTLADTTGGMIVGAIGRDGFKQTGGGSYVQAQSAYTGVLSSSGTLPVVSTAVLEDSNALICFGATIPALSAKGQVLMRPIATGNAIQGIVQCPPVQTAATISQFVAEVTGPSTARTIVARIEPLPEDRGKTRKLFSWAVAPDGRQYMQTGPNQWEAMTEPMRPAATITVPAAGPYRLEVTRAMKLDQLLGTQVFIGIGETWEEVRGLNKAGHYYTLQ